MGRHQYIKPEPPEVRGTCVKCGLNKQKRSSKGKYRAICSPCSKRLYEVDNRREYRMVKKSYCESCHFIPEHPCQLDVDHVDGDHNNNHPENLQTLCANCHRLKTHLSRDWMNKEQKDG